MHLLADLRTHPQHFEIHPHGFENRNGLPLCFAVRRPQKNFAMFPDQLAIASHWYSLEDLEITEVLDTAGSPKIGQSGQFRILAISPVIAGRGFCSTSHNVRTFVVALFEFLVPESLHVSSP